MGDIADMYREQHAEEEGADHPTQRIIDCDDLAEYINRAEDRISQIKLHQHFRALNHVVATAVQTMSKEDAERSKADWFQLARIAKLVSDPFSKSRYELYGEVMRTRIHELEIMRTRHIEEVKQCSMK